MTARRPLTDAERLDWLRLFRSENVGPITFFALLERFGSAAARKQPIAELGILVQPLALPLELGIAALIMRDLGWRLRRCIPPHLAGSQSQAQLLQLIFQDRNRLTNPSRNRCPILGQAHGANLCSPSR